MEIALEDYKRAFSELKREEARKGFIAHLASYLQDMVHLPTPRVGPRPRIQWIDGALDGLEAEVEKRARGLRRSRYS